MSVTFAIGQFSQFMRAVGWSRTGPRTQRWTRATREGQIVVLETLVLSRHPGETLTAAVAAGYDIRVGIATEASPPYPLSWAGANGWGWDATATPARVAADLIERTGVAREKLLTSVRWVQAELIPRLAAVTAPPGWMPTPGDPRHRNWTAGERWASLRLEMFLKRLLRLSLQVDGHERRWRTVDINGDAAEADRVFAEVLEAWQSPDEHPAAR